MAKINETKNAIIKYNDTQISLFSDDRDDYINLTDIANAWRNRKSIKSWLKNKQTLEFLNVWERKHNPNFDGTQIGTVLNLAKDTNSSLSIKFWIEQTRAIGIFTRTGNYAGTYAHKDIAIRFAGWLSPEFELYLVEEIQKLKDLEKQKYSYELLTHEQILYLVQLKEVFKYVAHQELIEDAHKEKFASTSNAKNPFAEFHKWRNEILDIKPEIINERIKQYCIKNNIALTKKFLEKTKREKILILDSYESVRNAVWDFLQIKEAVNALNLANLVGDMIRTEKGEILRVNEDNLFQKKQNLGEFTDFKKVLSEMPEIKTARQLLEYKKNEDEKRKQLTGFNKNLKKALEYKE